MALLCSASGATGMSGEHKLAPSPASLPAAFAGTPVIAPRQRSSLARCPSRSSRTMLANDGPAAQHAQEEGAARPLLRCVCPNWLCCSRALLRSHQPSLRACSLSTRRKNEVKFHGRPGFQEPQVRPWPACFVRIVWRSIPARPSRSYHALSKITES